MNKKIIEAMEVVNRFKDDEIVKKYNEAISIMVNSDFFGFVKAEKELYKKVGKWEYYIELPYKEIILENNKYVIKQRSYSYYYTKGENKGGAYGCRSHCNETKQDMIDRLEEQIKSTLEGDRNE